jgi:hypothetical protein
VTGSGQSDEEEIFRGVHGHGQLRSAKSQTEEYEPTVKRQWMKIFCRVPCTSIFKTSSLPMRLLCISW